MLLLSRKEGEVICIGSVIKVMVVKVRGDKVRIGIEAPKDVMVHRLEIFEAIQEQNNAERTDND